MAACARGWNARGLAERPGKRAAPHRLRFPVRRFVPRVVPSAPDPFLEPT